MDHPTIWAECSRYFCPAFFSELVNKRKKKMTEEKVAQFTMTNRYSSV